MSADTVVLPEGAAPTGEHDGAGDGEGSDRRDEPAGAGASGRRRGSAPSLFDRPPSLRERRSLQPVDRLSRDLGNVCTTAVDPLEIAAILEAQGVTDAVARGYYNSRDVFHLAERLWERTPAVVDEEPERIDPDQPGSFRDLVHGVLFALNGLFFSAGLSVAHDRASIIALVLALVASWAAGQASALLWYRLQGRKGDRAARAVLRRSMQVVLVLGLVGGWVGHRLDLPPSVTLMAVAQVYLVVAASALLLYRKEIWFFLSLVPALTAVVASWAAPELFDAGRVLPVVVVSVLVLVLEGLWLARPYPKGDNATHVQWADLGAAGQMATYGVMGAILLSHAAMSSLVTGVHHDVRGVDISVLPLVLTIGVAEWELRSYRQLTRQVLGLTDDLGRFGTVAWRFLLRSLARYWAAVVLVSVALWVGSRMVVGSVSTETTLVTVAYAVLGGALFLNLVLVAHARVDLALRSMIGAATLYGVGLVVLSSLDDHPEVLAAVYLALCLGLFLSSLLATRSIVRQALVHL